MLRLPVGEEEFDRRALLAKAARRAERVDDEIPLQNRGFARHLVAAQGGDHLVGVTDAAVTEQPARRLGEEHHRDGYRQGEDDLERDGEAPGEVGRAVRCAVVDPVCHQGPKSDGASLDADQEAAVRSLGAFGFCFSRQ